MKMQNPGQSWALAVNMTMGSVIERKSDINYPIFSLQLGQDKNIGRTSHSPSADWR